MIASPLLICVLAAPQSTLPPPSDAAAFHRSLDAALDHADAGEFAAAREEITALLEAHRELDDALARLTEIREALARCTFYADYRPPKPEELTDGELISYSSTGARFRIRYRDARGAKSAATDHPLEERLAESPDFDKLENAIGHRASFDGPCTLRFAGRPGEHAQHCVSQIAVGRTTAARTVVGLGERNQGRTTFPGFVRTITPSGTRTIATKPWLAPDPEESCSVEVRVTEKEIVAIVDGSLFLRVERPELTGSGRVAFVGLHELAELDLAGNVSLAWIGGLSDQHQEQAWSTFMQQQSRGDALLPEWLRARAGSAPAADQDPLFVLPYADDPRTAAASERLRDFLESKALREGSRYFQDLSETVCLPSVRDYALALLAAERNLPRRALLILEGLGRADPGCTIARVLAGRIHARMGHDADALASFEEAIRAAPAEAEAYRQLALHQLHRGRLAGAREAVAQARAAGIPPYRLRDVDSLLVRAAQGPPWKERFGQESEHFLVSSDLSRRACAEASRELERALKLYRHDLGDSAGTELGAEKAAVFLFSGKSRYMEYARDLLGESNENTLGLYVLALRQLLLWEQPEHEATLTTLRHEGLHRYLHEACSSVPTWFDEGLAVYYQTADDSLGTAVVGAAHQESLFVLCNPATKWVSFGELLDMGQREFYANAQLNYPQSWALVHFLLHESDETREVFRAYWNALRSGSDADEARRAAFGAEGLENLERRARQHVFDVRAQGGR